MRHEKQINEIAALSQRDKRRLIRLYRDNVYWVVRKIYDDDYFLKEYMRYEKPTVDETIGLALKYKRSDVMDEYGKIRSEGWMCDLCEKPIKNAQPLVHVYLKHFKKTA